MSLIYVNFNQAMDLSGFVSGPAPVGGGFVPAVNNLPQNTGIYAIINLATNNSYIGIAGDFRDRFINRQEASVAFGLTTNDMANIVVWFATMADIRVFNTPNFNGNNNLFPPNLALNGGGGIIVGPPIPGGIVNGFVPHGIIGTENVVNNPANNAMPSTVDGVNVDIEAVIIRQYINASTVQYNTNTQKRTPFTNTSGGDVYVIVNYCGAAGNAGSFTQRYIINGFNF